MIVVCPPYAACPTQHHQTVQVRVEQRPSINWPDDWKPHDQPEQDHPSHEDPSPMYTGLLASNINVSNTAAHVVNDSGATGNSPYTTLATTWLQVGSPLAMSTRDLDHGERLMPPCAYATNVAPNAKRHLANPSTRKMFEVHSGGRGKQ